ncbi:glycosyltransferase [Streptomyces sp. OUCMDZ-4982]|uniref:glycosyltransferase family 4 protein n=1 Tax=Streptomyces sp. OUCMDZ-4982 TaxID=2973090 RepID=UPI00215BAFCF|nr:glycosyltransferase [Streptomyces sp. OUCMDZ-4982]MCR8945114.1 glycosyltransferase [Streptomyces sp. OUCMDZ-4982]
MREDTRAVVVALHDGFFGCGTGAGHSNRRVLELLDGMLAPQVELVVVPVRLEKDSEHFDAAWHRQVQESLDRSGRAVRIVPVDNGTGGRRRFGGLDAFNGLTAAALREITAVRARFGRGLVLLLDVPFLSVAAELEQRPGWDTLVLPRSSAALHCPQHTRRVEWERENLHRAAAGGVRIGAISQAMRRHLVEDLGVDAEAVVDLVNGLTERDRDFTPGRGAELLPTAVAGAGFWFAMGRAVPRKGLMDLLQALVELRGRGQELEHLVLAAVGESDELTDHQRELAAYVSEHGLPVTLLTRFSAEVRQLLAHPALRMVVVPSRVEPFGRIPLEAYAAGAAPVVATTAGGLAEQVEDSVSGFTAAPGDVPGLADAVARAAAADDRTRERMRAAGQERLRAFDYRRNLGRALHTIAPWSLGTGPATPAPSPRWSVGAGLSVLQVPEECGWNPYVAAGERALAGAGLAVLRPGLCLDNPNPPAGLPALPNLEGVRPDVVHLHWPEKLARQYGVQTALRVLTRLKEDGALIVQTVHNLAPHEPTGPLASFARHVDALSDGAHFFSPGHEVAARLLRPYLPRDCVHVPHPLMPTPPASAPGSRRGGPLSVGCFGRLRDYKRTLPFAHAFLDGAPPAARLLVAGAPDTPETHNAFAQLAAADARLDYRPGFRDDHDDFWELLGEVEWVALPYERLHSSGVLVAALQARRRILSPTPIGGTGLYARDAHRWWWTTVDPWDDEKAVAAWSSTALFSPAVPPSALALPAWPRAAEHLAAFYARLTPRTAPLPVPRRAAPARVGIL